MTQPLFDNLGPITQRIAMASYLLVGLDYEGTLTPIVDEPPQAVLDDEVRNFLQILAAQAATFVAIVSGRHLPEVKSLINVDGLIYAGNRGLEIAGPDFNFVEPTAVKRSKALRCLAPVVKIPDYGF